MIEVKNIYKSFGDNTVLCGFNAEFPKGVPCFLTGATGKGKTTLLRIITGLEKADKGKVVLNDIKGFGVVFQEDRLFEKLSIERNIKYVTDKPLSLNLVDKLGLKNYLGKPVKNLSGGTKRRCAILRALSFDADALVMDEPFNGLDDDMKIQVMNAVLECAKDKVLIISTHDKDIIACAETGARVFEID